MIILEQEKKYLIGNYSPTDKKVRDYLDLYRRGKFAVLLGNLKVIASNTGQESLFENSNIQRLCEFILNTRKPQLEDLKILAIVEDELEKAKQPKD